MSERDHRVLWTLQGLVLGLPLFLGGRQTLAVAGADVAVLALLLATLRARRRSGVVPYAPGLGALVAFVALGLATTVPLPPAVLAILSPATWRLYAQTLPGWPGGGGWSVWRSLAIAPWGTWIELSRFGIGFGVFAVLVAHPWGECAAEIDLEARERVFGRLIATLLAGGATLAGLALLEEIASDGNVLWITDIPTVAGRASGPFVNPNHFAAWLEMIMPMGLAYAFTLYRRMYRRLVSSAQAGRGMGVSARRAWVAALVVHQRTMWAPLVAAAALLIMLVAHVATGSRGGTAALCVGLGVAGTGMLRSRRSGRSSLRRWLPFALSGLLVVGAAVSVVAWGLSGETEHATAAADGADVGLGARIAVSIEGAGVVRDHPLFGTGLGSWLHAFRPYVEPPVEGGIWDHAHDDVLELAAETGVAGCVIVLFFAWAVARTLRARGTPAPSGAVQRYMPGGFQRPDWLVALGDRRVRWGLVGGVCAILVHSVVDFGLHMPANMLLLMMVLALLVLTRAPRPAHGGLGIAALALLLVVPLLPQALNAVLVVAGGAPLSPADCLQAADLLVAQDGDKARPEGVALVKRALDRSPADCEAHAALAKALGDGPDGDEALRRGLALNPWSADMRDDLAFRLLERGEDLAGATEVEESMYRFPSLVSHSYLTPELDGETVEPARLMQALRDGDTMAVRLASLEPPVAAAIERGLIRALADVAAGDDREAIVSDQATLLEARERWHDAAALLDRESRGSDDVAGLSRAARDYVKAENFDAAESALLAAVMHAPDAGDLYQSLAVDVYAARGEFPMAESVLQAGERNAVDLLPVYDGLTEVLEKREEARTGQLTVASTGQEVREEEFP